MSWQFDKPILKIVNNSVYKLGIFSSSSDVSSTENIKTASGYYLPLSSGTSGNYNSNFKIVKNSSSYFPHENKITCKVSYTRNTYSPTSGVYQYYWKITAIEFEAPLPCASKFYSGSTLLKEVSANTKKITGSPIFQTPIQTASSCTVSFSASFGGKTVAGSFSLGSASSTSFIIS